MGPDALGSSGKITTRLPGGHGSAIVYHDSFGLNWMPFLGYHFGTVDYYWQTQLDPKTIEQKRPAIVIVEMLERVFDTTDPRKLYTEDGLH